jgi:hypothetical protein
MRSHDEAAISADELYAVRLGGVTDRGQERRHYPDALLIDPHGRRLALELELSHKGVSRLAEIVAGYAADRRLDGVIYLVENSSAGRQIGRAIKASTIQMDASERIHVRRVMPIGHLSRPRHGPARRPTRSRAPAGLDAGR